MNYYDLLGLTEDATPEEIRRAYREAALRYHPDINLDVGAVEEFMKIQEAYDVLNDSEARKVYDEKLDTQQTDPINLEILYSRQFVSSLDEDQLIYALLNCSALPEEEQPNVLPINISLILDRSTSMQGERMDTVKKAAVELIRQLGKDDYVSLVVFSDRAEVLLPAGQYRDHGVAETQIRMIKPGGGTEIYRGLEAGYSEILQFSNQSLINHIILITDGRTYGDEDNCLDLAKRAASHGIRFTGLGIGTEWNDIFLDELTTRTGGSSFYISRTNDIQAFLQERFKNLTQVYAEKVSLNLEVSAGVTLNTVYRLRPDASNLPLTSPIRLGSISKNTQLSLLLEFIVAPVPARTTRIVLASGELEMALSNNHNSLINMPVKLSRLVSDTVNNELPPRAIYQALSQVALYRMQDKARQEVSEGKIQEASIRLQRLATQLLSIGERELAQTALMEAERIQRTHILSAEGEKTIKYGTRSLLLPAYIEGR